MQETRPEHAQVPREVSHPGFVLGNSALLAMQKCELGSERCRQLNPTAVTFETSARGIVVLPLISELSYTLYLGELREYAGRYLAPA